MERNNNIIVTLEQDLVAARNLQLRRSWRVVSLQDGIECIQTVLCGI